MLICVWKWDILGEFDNDTSCVIDALAESNETFNPESATCFVCLDLSIPLGTDPSTIPPFTCMPPAPQNSCDASDVAVFEGCEGSNAETRKEGASSKLVSQLRVSSTGTCTGLGNPHIASELAK